ncbi:MAG: hypothetical protein EBY29_13130, partial [Planctomycetes bacterium]|nr:hypothetical protein [Planctomycetota bacterium]
YIIIYYLEQWVVVVVVLQTRSACKIVTERCITLMFKVVVIVIVPIIWAYYLYMVGKLYVKMLVVDVKAILLLPIILLHHHHHHHIITLLLLVLLTGLRLNQRGDVISVRLLLLTVVVIPVPPIIRVMIILNAHHVNIIHGMIMVDVMLLVVMGKNHNTVTVITTVKTIVIANGARLIVTVV